MAKVDLLSQHADHNHGKVDNLDVILLKPQHFWATSFDVEELDEDIVAQIKDHHVTQDTAIIKALTNKEKNWGDDGELITWEHCLCVPHSAQL